MYTVILFIEIKETCGKSRKNINRFVRLPLLNFKILNILKVPIIFCSNCKLSFKYRKITSIINDK